MSKSIFITATGTDVGKTYVTALLVKALRKAGKNAGYYKAALSGALAGADGRLIPGDADQVLRTAGLAEMPESCVSYIYKEAVSPHLAAQWEGNPAEMAVIERDFAAASARFDYLTVEGSGGIVCPIRWDSQKILLEDIISHLGLSVLITAVPALGSINSCVLTAEYLKSRRIPIKGFIMNRFHANDPMEEDNCRMIESLTQLPIVAKIPDNAQEFPLDPKTLCALYTIPQRR